MNALSSPVGDDDGRADAAASRHQPPDGVGARQSAKGERARRHERVRECELQHALEHQLAQARDTAEASRDRFAFLAEVSRRLAASLDYESTLITVAGMSLPYLGAWCIVDLCTDGGDGPDACDQDERGQDGGFQRRGIRRVAVLHPDPAKQTVARELQEYYPPQADDPLGAPCVIRTGRPEVVVEVADAAYQAMARDAEHLRLLRALGIGAYVIAPMVARGRTVGAMTFVTTESGRCFGDLDVLLAEDLATRAALAVDNARLYAEALQVRQEARQAQIVAEQAQRVAENAQVLAEQASRAKSEFLAVMSHELRTPLNAIIGYIDLLEMGVHGPLTREQRADLARIQRNQRHLMGLINNVLNYSRLEASAVHYDIGDVGIADLFDTCEALVAPQASTKRLALAFDGCDLARKVRADAEKLQQIVLNLLTNAIKFTEPGGRITVGCTSKPHEIAITVADTGLGIPAEQLERIFEPFVQVDAQLTRTQGGVGLGLAISRDLARGMGGDLTVRSTPGTGSEFTVLVPCA